MGAQGNDMFIFGNQCGCGVMDSDEGLILVFHSLMAICKKGAIFLWHCDCCVLHLVLDLENSRLRHVSDPGEGTGIALALEIQSASVLHFCFPCLSVLPQALVSFMFSQLEYYIKEGWVRQVHWQRANFWDLLGPSCETPPKGF